jgi:Glycosyl hydrolases family 2, TIM barrel domain/Glycosyl hydrolases family 2, sugar binding domain/Glycosyl hydrolases family 2
MPLQQSLAGLWLFQLDPEGIVHVSDLNPDRSIQVPMPMQAAFPELETYSGYTWYVRDLEMDDKWLQGELLLTFGAVDYWCQVYINGQLAGEHEGGYTPFTLPIRKFVQMGTNQIAVRVYDAAYTGTLVPRWYKDQPTNQPFNPIHIPHGKQSWYLDASGIWQDVTLTAVPAVYIDRVYITPAIKGEATVDVLLAGDLTRAEGTLRVTIKERSAEVPLVAKHSRYKLTIQVESPHLWTPETPNLYTAEITLSGAAGDDSKTVRFGFREIAVQDGRLLLNGEPLFLLAALDQDMYPGTIYSVPSEEFLRDEFRKAKELGLNCLRCHIKPPDPLYLQLADEMGLLVWAEIPSWRTFYTKTKLQHTRHNVTDDIKARVRQTFDEMVARDFNHPSLVIWTVVNEDWGTAVQLSPNDRAWLAEMYDACKALDPTRLVVDNSACLTNIHVKSDLDDYHIYTNIPDQAEFFEQFIHHFSRRANWTYSSHGDAQRSGNEALILSEFGNWGLPSVEALRESNGALPDWFKLGPWWSGWEGEPGWPAGVLERFDCLGLKAIWSDYEAFAQASQWHQFEAMKYEIEIMRRQPALSGYVITELSDIYWESNGLMDFNRGNKVYHHYFALVNTPDVVIPRLRRYATWDDQPLPMQVFGAHYSPADWSAAKLHLTFNGQSTEQTLPALPRGEVADWGVQELRFAPADKAATQQIDLEVVAQSGEGLAHNHVDVLVLPAAARQPAFHGSLTVDTLENDNSALASALQKAGYSFTDQLSPDTLIVTDTPSDDALRQVRGGGTLLYLMTSDVGPFFWRQSRGGVYGGNWITCFSWLRPDVFRRLNVSNPLTLPYQAVMPEGVLIGLPVEDQAVQSDFLGGQITGWINHPAIHTVQFRYGKGRVLMTTFELTDALNRRDPDPVAVAMLHDLIDHVHSEAFAPTLKANY